MQGTIVRVMAFGCALSVLAHGQPIATPGPALLHGRALVDAHNAYPEAGRWHDRITRALAIAQSPVVVEQDIAFAPRNEPRFRSVVSHEPAVKGQEPSLEEHFFDRIKPLVERALAAGHKDQWPAVVLHLDFKTNEREHHRAVWDLLRRYQSWLTTAAFNADPTIVSEAKAGPLLVLTENGAGQEKDFSEWASAGGSFLLFGSIPPPAVRQSDDAAERARILGNASPGELIPTAATTYRRWVNFPWAVVEGASPSEAAAWTPEERRRLEAVVNYAHQQRLLIRFYTLNGHAPAAGRGWTASYNFGSPDAVRQRWAAAIDARVDLIATDQYEELAELMRGR